MYMYIYTNAKKKKKISILSKKCKIQNIKLLGYKCIYQKPPVSYYVAVINMHVVIYSTENK